MKRVIGPVIALLLLAGCASTAATTTPTSTSAPATSTGTAASQRLACQGLAKVNASLTTLAAVGDSTTVGDVKTTQQQVAQQLTTLDTLIPGDAGPALSKMTSANDQLGTKLQGLPESDTLSQASVNVQQVHSQVADAQNAAKNLGTTLQCGS